MSVSLSPAGVDEVEDEEDFLSFTNGAWAKLRVALGEDLGPFLEPPRTLTVAEVSSLIGPLSEVEIESEMKMPLLTFLERMVRMNLAVEVN